jgi:hypothetical protein
MIGGRLTRRRCQALEFRAGMFSPYHSAASHGDDVPALVILPEALR